MTSQRPGGAQVPPHVASHRLSSLGLQHPSHTPAVRPGPQVVLTRSDHKAQGSGNQVRGTSSRRATPSDAFFLQPPACVLVRARKANSRGTSALCWEGSGHRSASAKRAQLQRSPNTDGQHLIAQRPGTFQDRPGLGEAPECRQSLWPSGQGPSCPLDPLWLLGQRCSGISASQSCPGWEGDRIGRAGCPAALPSPW